MSTAHRCILNLPAVKGTRYIYEFLILLQYDPTKYSFVNEVSQTNFSTGPLRLHRLPFSTGPILLHRVPFTAGHACHC